MAWEGGAVAVVTADQRASRRRQDLVPAALDLLSGCCAGVLLGFERTVGDEIQGVCTTAGTVVEVVLRLTRLGGWRVGIGIGSIERPLPSSTRQARGTAFLMARQAVETRRSPQGLRLLSALTGEGRGSVSTASYGGLQDAARYAESALIGLRALASRRTPEGWEVSEMAANGASQAQIAEQLRVSRSAISQRLAIANFDEVNRLAELTALTLAAAMEADR